MNKKVINEASITDFIDKFLDGIQSGTQRRFIKQAEKRGVPRVITTRLTKIEKEVIELRKILKELP